MARNQFHRLAKVTKVTAADSERYALPAKAGKGTGDRRPATVVHKQGGVGHRVRERATGKQRSAIRGSEAPDQARIDYSKLR